METRVAPEKRASAPPVSIAQLCGDYWRRWQVGGLTYIYVLRDPRTNEVRYVGKSDRPFRRLLRHLNARGDSHRDRWIDLLQRQQLSPILEVVDEVPKAKWKEAERFWIAHFLCSGANLTNMTDGGDAPPVFRGPHTKEARAKISAASKGNIMSEESIRRSAEAKQGKPRSEETKRKISATLTGRKNGPLSEAHKAKLRASQLGRVLSDETKAKIGLASRGRVISEETKRKLSIALQGREFTQKHREKIGKALTGRIMSKEWRERLGRAHMKLSDHEVEQVIVLLDEGKLMQREIASLYNVSPSFITRIKQRTGCYARFV